MDMDKKDLIAFFQELRLFYGEKVLNENITEIEKIFENTNIDKLDIKRIYRYLDKNVKRDIVVFDEEDSADFQDY
jgi:predicted nucleic acid-binding protein